MNAESKVLPAMKFERTRRITGYLVGSLERFNNAKRAEERARVKHEMPKRLPTDCTLSH